jgi:hypothetical protein
VKLGHVALDCTKIKANASWRGRIVAHQGNDMTHETLPLRLHPSGEQLAVESEAAQLSSFAGPVRVEWDRSSPLTPLGQLVYFIEYSKSRAGSMR